MKNQNNIIILTITVIFMSIGFVILSLELTKLSNKKIIYDAKFTTIKENTSIKGSNNPPIGKTNITKDGKELEIEFTLYTPHDEVSYIATIENKGNKSIKIVDLLKSPDYDLKEYEKLISPISIKTTDITGRVLAPKEKIDIKITAYYNPSTLELKEQKVYYKVGLITKSA